MRAYFVFALIPFLGGCAGSVMESALNPQAVVAREDAYCQSIGAAPGTPGYTDCRLQLNGQRQQNHRAAWAGAAYLASQSQPRYRNCTSTVIGNQLQTQCY